ncbi:unnamed protein product [Fraxinus pennsylvanica]|uniref:Uncharacterized protein n=1 Tax=Fraxinus pennsylvanica TaxID=56036 RepID=A0AAD2DP49_9LAMI|nr:unnamed protein product [Fraxinus pennsylvanica]
MDQFKKVVKLMYRALKKSLKSNDLHMSLWRRLAYLQAKWFGSYKRTINEIPGHKASNANEGISWKRSIGFVLVPTISYRCKEDFGSKVCERVENLASLNWPCNSMLP